MKERTKRSNSCEPNSVYKKNKNVQVKYEQQRRGHPAHLASYNLNWPHSKAYSQCTSWRSWFLYIEKQKNSRYFRCMLLISRSFWGKRVYQLFEDHFWQYGSIFFHWVRTVTLVVSCLHGWVSDHFFLEKDKSRILGVYFCRFCWLFITQIDK